MRTLSIRSIHSLIIIAVVAGFSSTLMGCPDKASPDPASATDAGTTAAAKAPAVKAGASAAAPAKSGGW